jgi:chaperonin GroES
LLKSIKNNVIVELIEKEKVTSGGIILTNADPDQVSKGKVIAIGDETLDVKVNDIILPNWNAAKQMKYEGQDLFVVKEEDIVLIFEE